jgi:mannose-1-phosphate guanylyltransferase
MAHLERLDPNGLAAFFPSDDYIANESVLIRHLERAFLEAARSSATVMLLGASPDAPEVEYGWIEPGTPLAGARAPCFHVLRFWEKPSRPHASALMELGCVWNPFIMVARVKAFLRLFERAAPALFRSLHPTLSREVRPESVSWGEFYAGIPSTNFSQAVLATMQRRSPCSVRMVSGGAISATPFGFSRSHSAKVSSGNGGSTRIPSGP